MRIRHAAPLVAGLALLASSPADAAPRRPQSGTVSATLLPQPVALSACASPAQVEGVNKKTATIKALGAGRLDVAMNGFYGDWDMVLLNTSGAVLATGAGTNIDGTNSLPNKPVTERLTYRSRRAQTMRLVVCNFSGSPNAVARWRYVYF